MRFTSPHPRDFTDDVIAAMAETPNVMPQLHMPLQSGSDAVLRRMRRSYRSARYLQIIENVRAAMPEAAITTDIIVGFPGETEADFQATLDVVAASRFAAAFTFQYSIRAGTPAATMPDRSRRGRTGTVRATGRPGRGDLLAGEPVPGRPDGRGMFADGEGRKDAATSRMSGRARDNRLVHVTVPDDPACGPVLETWPTPRSVTLPPPPERRRGDWSGCAGPEVGTPGRPDRPAPRPLPSGWACRRSGCRIRFRNSWPRCRLTDLKR